MTNRRGEKRAKLDLDYVRDLPGFTRSNPQYFADPMHDKLLDLIMNLSAELWILRDRQMVVEHLLANGFPVTNEAIEAFDPDAAFRKQLKQARAQMVERVFGTIYSEPKSDGVTEPT